MSVLLYHYSVDKKFIQLCHEAKNLETLEQLFTLFFTIEELEMLKARYSIIQELLKGEMTQREIAKRYGASIAQITRGSNALKTISPELQAFLRKSLGWWA